MLVLDFDYNLPEESIAKYPPKVRGATKLLVLNRKNGKITDSKYARLAEWLNPGDLVILNDTKVMRARLFTRFPDGRKRELVVLETHSIDVKDDVRTVMYRGKMHPGNELEITNVKLRQGTGHKIKVVEVLGGGLAKIKMSNQDSANIDEMVEKYGTVPLPPYLRREAEPADLERYQTVWAKHLGSAAAPTASLNMTAATLKTLKSKGINIKYLTLHVGLGTFLPIRTDSVENHHMHAEFFQIPADTIEVIQQAKAQNKRVVAVGTTVARALEYYAKTGKTEGEDDIFIYPGFKFKIVDALLTNFHAPRSTVLMLASAFAGWENLRPAYDYAIKNNYKLLSYGDSMLIC